MGSTQFQQPEPQRQQQHYHTPSPAELEAQRQANEARERQREAEARESKVREDEARCLTLQEELKCKVTQGLVESGFLPPSPPHLLWMRGVGRLELPSSLNPYDPVYSRAYNSVVAKMQLEHASSLQFVRDLTSVCTSSPVKQVTALLSGAHKDIGRATVSMDMPAVETRLLEKMSKVEVFLAEDWSDSNHRGVLAVYADEDKGQTILQIGLAEHGPIYVTIPRLLAPEELAERSIKALLKRLGPFCKTVDPMAVINGAHQGQNYNKLFPQTRVVRASSGDTIRLKRSLDIAARRERLAPENTAILSAIPHTDIEYRSVFKEDTALNHWRTWQGEAGQWASSVNQQFTVGSETSAEAFVQELGRAKNVIVLSAHCDGTSLFMPHPAPEGTVVTPEYLLEHREEIAANQPFVYLFSCKAGSTSNMRNFASILLECGALGVITAQGAITSSGGRGLLQNILNERRGSPPLQDYYRAMQETGFRDMEVFLD